jgi:hypothetical protein
MAALPLVIPLTGSTGWHVLSFAKIPVNEVRFGASGMAIRVEASAGPVVYPLATRTLVAGVQAEGRLLRGRLEVDSARQGQRGADDYVLRLGLVEAGSRRLDFLRRSLAPAWVRQLHALAPPGAGISRVTFLAVAQDPSRVGEHRRHPSSDLLHERVVAALDAGGRFRIDVRLDAPTEVGAIWLSSDGDDSKSAFEVQVESLVLLTEPQSR